MAEFDKKYNIINEPTPPNVPLTAHYKKSFAYYTIRERLPVILTQVLDQLSRDKDQIAHELCSTEEDLVKDEIKEVLGKISKLKYELQTDKTMNEFVDNENDATVWNDFLANLEADQKSYFTTTWLYAECYLYRRLKSFFEKSIYLKDFDYFRKQKENALTTSYTIMSTVIEQVNRFHTLNDKLNNADNLEEFFIQLVKLNLWGNRCDLSISVGREIKLSGENPFDLLQTFEQFILVDKCKAIWDCIQQSNDNNKPMLVDFIQDNSGYELFTDLVLAKFLIDTKLAGKIRFHIKAIPWFISDVNKHDFNWTLQTLAEHENTNLASFGKQCSDLVNNGQFVLIDTQPFWTSPYEFYRMQQINPNLYNQLTESDLLIFKGDLNYRKLLGDFNWSFEEAFETVLRDFRPTNLCSLRTVKADLICELNAGVAEELSQLDPMWMETGKYGVIHYIGKK